MTEAERMAEEYHDKILYSSGMINDIIDLIHAVAERTREECKATLKQFDDEMGHDEKFYDFYGIADCIDGYKWEEEEV